MTATPPVFLDVDATSIAVRHAAGATPGIVWLGGYKSDMLGTKAQTLSDWADGEGRAFVRHDYSGHGESGGAFADGTISKWLAQSLAVFRHFTKGKYLMDGGMLCRDRSKGRFGGKMNFSLFLFRQTADYRGGKYNIADGAEPEYQNLHSPAFFLE